MTLSWACAGLSALLAVSSSVLATGELLFHRAGGDHDNDRDNGGRKNDCNDNHGTGRYNDDYDDDDVADI